MCSRYFLFITLLLLCHEQMHAQLFTNALPAADPSNTIVRDEAQQTNVPVSAAPASPDVPDDPSQQILPIARPEPLPATGVPVHWTTGPNGYQEHVGDVSTVSGEVVLYYKNYVIHADKIVYHHSTS